MNRKAAKELIASLDRIAEHVENNWTEVFASEEAAVDFCLDLNRRADLIESRLAAREGLVEPEVEMAGTTKGRDKDLMRDADEDFVDHYHAPSEVIQRDADEPYVDHYNDNDYNGVQEYIAQDRRNEGNPLARRAAYGDNWYDRRKKN